MSAIHLEAATGRRYTIFKRYEVDGYFVERQTGRRYGVYRRYEVRS